MAYLYTLNVTIGMNTQTHTFLINNLEGILNINVMIESYETAIFVGQYIYAKVWMMEQSSNSILRS